MKLPRRYVEKPWGRTQLPPMFDPPAGERIGEVWFDDGGNLPLLAKYIFTSERLSIQVHPNDEQARQRGLPQGKSECWYILDAEPGATLGLGLRYSLSAEQLRSAALDGSIEQLMDWRPVSAGDFFFVPAGTVHAIGAGIALLEFQQNVDVTYRLYDYGRPRELHLDEGIAAANRAPYDDSLAKHGVAAGERTLVDGPHFTLVHTDRDRLQDRQRWVLPLDGEVRSGNTFTAAGECLLLGPSEELSGTHARMLIGAAAETLRIDVRRDCNESGLVRVLFYGRLAEAIAPELQVEARSGCSVGKLRGCLADAHPAAAEILLSRRARACIDNALVEDDYVVGEAQTVEFLPPVSGG
jgi:mannose-6-phosphate isomerase